MLHTVRGVNNALGKQIFAGIHKLNFYLLKSIQI